MKITVRFEGGAQMAQNLRTLSSRLSKRILIEALTEAAEPMRKTMAIYAPVETGRLAHRSMVVRTSRGQDIQEAAVAVGPSLKGGFYGGLQEFGTRYHAAQPFARPAFDENVYVSLKILGEAIWRELAAHAGPRPMVEGNMPVIGGSEGGSLV